LFAGAWDEGPGYPRTAALRQGFAAAGIEVSECRMPGLGARKRALLRRLWRHPWRLPGCLLGALWRRWRFARELRAALRRERPDLVVVPYPGHFAVRAVAAAAEVPVVLDLFLSAFDTAVIDRGLFAERSLPAGWLRALDQRACAAADLVLLDTPEHARHVRDLVGLPPERFDWVPIGDPEAPDRAAAYVAPPPGRLRLLFFGTGVPLHGLPVLIAAVRQVPAVQFVLVGGTPADRELAQVQLGGRVDLQPEFVARARLQEMIEDADLVAGVFDSGGKAARVVPFKVVHALAAGRPVVTADTEAVRRCLCDGEGAFLVPAGDAAALAARLRALAAEPSVLAAAAAAARGVYERCFAPVPVGARLLEALAVLPGGPE
jgi:glycosyltransferase involved in cell wall biosynthesis